MAVFCSRFNLPADPQQQPSRVRRSQSQPRLSQVVSRLEQETMSFTNKKTEAKRRTVSRSPDSHKRSSLNYPSPRLSPQRTSGAGESASNKHSQKVGGPIGGALGGAPVGAATSTTDRDSGQ